MTSCKVLNDGEVDQEDSWTLIKSYFDKNTYINW